MAIFFNIVIGILIGVLLISVAIRKPLEYLYKFIEEVHRRTIGGNNGRKGSNNIS